MSDFKLVQLLNQPYTISYQTGIIPFGAYNNSQAYIQGDSVSYNGSSYICILASTGNLPTDTTYWQVLANKGDTGATGPAGPAGLTYTHTQSSPSTSWNVNHNLGIYPTVQVLSIGNQVVDCEVSHVSINQLTINFVSNQTGTARCN